MITSITATVYKMLPISKKVLKMNDENIIYKKPAKKIKQLSNEHFLYRSALKGK